MNRPRYFDRSRGRRNLILHNPESTTSPLSSIQASIQHYLHIVEDRIRALIWEHTAIYRAEDALIDRDVSHIEEQQFEAEVTHRSEQLEHDSHFVQAKGQLVVNVGSKDEVRPLITPLMEKRSQLLRLLRYLRKTDPLCN